MKRKRTVYEFSVIDRNGKTVWWTKHYPNKSDTVFSSSNTKKLRTKKHLKKFFNYWIEQEAKEITIQGFVITKSRRKCIMDETYIHN